MNPVILARRQEQASTSDARTSEERLDPGAPVDDGLISLADEELEFFDTVGVNLQAPTDELAFAGVRIRH